MANDRDPVHRRGSRRGRVHRARAVGPSIFTEADDLAQLRDAVRCHFQDTDRPKAIRLHLVHDEVIAA